MSTPDDQRTLRSTSMPTMPLIEPAEAATKSVEDQLVELFFDRAPMGVAVFDTDLRLQRCNKTWTHFYEHYLGVGPDYTSPGVTLNELIPGNEESVQALVDAALAGQVIRQAAHRIAIPGRETFWDVVFAPLYEDGRIVGVVDIVTDATDRVLSLRRLQARVATFTRVATAMSLDQPLDAILSGIVSAVGETTSAYGASVVSWDSSGQRAAVAHADPALGEGLADAIAQTWSRDDMPVRAPEGPRVIRRHGMRQVVLDNPAFEALRPYAVTATWDELVIVPLIASGLSFGELHVYLDPGTELDSDDEQYLVALADQAAVAAQNAELFAAGSKAAELEARHQIARDLHDSVSQALFSMTLHSAAAARHLEATGLADHPAATQVAELRALTQGALAEMRALIFELRPDALAEEGLASALTKQAAAISSRERLTVRVEAKGDVTGLAPEVEEHLYRLVLESVHNAVKHAEASRIDVGLSVSTDGAALLVTVRDDGRGFDAGQSYPGHLGLHTMAERAESMGATLTTTSRPGRGTTVSVSVPLR
ncbi:MAG: histidine kinase [Intrasporangium sp.]|uniref:sensor histidine kinase n=1 Tax=Intrasporangium sp. TaxID=1925024 RepID=UPI0026478C94|nr:ATP-binding protein [Intrasporangium sp.]MDN5794547.1 histidine kinase [Intrasporangium sp.]